LEAWIYTRRSRALEDAEESRTLPAHVALLQRTARTDGVQVPPERVLTEIGSGEHIEGRPVFRRVLETWERLPRSVGGRVYVTDIDRLSRGDQMDWGRISNALSRANLLIRTPSRVYDLNSAEDPFLFGIELLLAKRELDQIKKRLERGRKEKRMNGGLANGTAPFGYTYSQDLGTLLPHPERFLILTRCCVEARTISVKQLAQDYGVPENCLRRALRNPTICGWPARHYGPSDPDDPSRDSYVPIPRVQWDWPEKVNEEYPHACTREEWELLQLALDRRREMKAQNHRLDGWCRDVVEFAGYPGRVRLGGLVTSQRKSGNLHLLVYERKAAEEPFLYVARETVHTAARAALGSLLRESDLLSRALADYRKRQADRANRKEVVTDLESLSRSLESEIHRQALTSRRRRLEETVLLLEKDLCSLRSVPAGPVSLIGLADDLPWIARHFEHLWDEWEPPQRQQLINACIARMEVAITPAPTPQPYRREVAQIEHEEWLQPFFGNCAA
jgi:DNA invertase Pin-like site-specific DNA recombinase